MCFCAYHEYDSNFTPASSLSSKFFFFDKNSQTIEGQTKILGGITTCDLYKNAFNRPLSDKKLKRTYWIIVLFNLC